MRARALVALAIAWALVAAAPASAQEGKKVLRLGQAQEPQTLSPFIDQDEEDFRIWSITYDLLVNFSPKDLGPTPGIAEKWTISPDKKTVTFNLFEGRKWSDGQPITSKDVKYSLETFAPNSLLFPSYVENITAVETPDPSDGGHQDQAARRAHRRRAVRLHPARARLGQAVGEVAHRVLQAADPDRRQRPVRGHGVRPRPHHPDDPQQVLPGPKGEVRRDPVDQVRHQRRGRAGAHAGGDRHHPRGPGRRLRAARQGQERQGASSRPRPRSRS